MPASRRVPQKDTNILHLCYLFYIPKSFHQIQDLSWLCFYQICCFWIMWIFIQVLVLSKWIRICWLVPFSFQCKDFIDAGATQLLTPADVVSSSDVTFSCLSDPIVVKEVKLILYYAFILSYIIIFGLCNL